MLKLINEVEAKRIIGDNSNAHLTVRISALLEAYGTDCPFFNVWRNDEGSLAARLSGSWFVYAAVNADVEELASFFVLNGAKTISSNAETVKNISKFVDSSHNITNCNILKTDNVVNLDLFGKNSEIETNPKLSVVYDILKDCENENLYVGGFDGWFTDMSHRIRHRCADAYLLNSAACCLVSFKSRFAGLIGAVAVRPEFRGNGYAKLIVGFARNELIKSGRLPIIECADELIPFYNSLGFEAIERGASLHIL